MNATRRIERGFPGLFPSSALVIIRSNDHIDSLFHQFQHPLKLHLLNRKILPSGFEFRNSIVMKNTMRQSTSLERMKLSKRNSALARKMAQQFQVLFIFFIFHLFVIAVIVGHRGEERNELIGLECADELIHWTWSADIHVPSAHWTYRFALKLHRAGSNQCFRRQKYIKLKSQL